MCQGKNEDNRLVARLNCWDYFIEKQECIPVGCVPAAYWPYAGVCFPGGGVVWFRGGAWSGRGVWSPGGVWSGGVWSQGGLVRGGLLWGGCGIQACTEAEPLPVDRQTPVKTLPWPNFIAAGNNNTSLNQDVPVKKEEWLDDWVPAICIGFFFICRLFVSAPWTGPCVVQTVWRMITSANWPLPL